MTRYIPSQDGTHLFTVAEAIWVQDHPVWLDDFDGSLGRRHDAILARALARGNARPTITAPTALATPAAPIICSECGIEKSLTGECFC